MKSVEFLSGRYPVKAVFSERIDLDRYKGWADPQKRIGILANFLHTPISNIVGANESHSSSIRLVTRDDPQGVTVLVDERYTMGEAGGYDGVVTDVPGVMIYLWTADCIPLYLYDPIHHVCAMAHNGWRGVCGGITQNALNVMREHFGTRAKDIIAAIGQCICESCYEVGEELLESFAEHFGQQTAESFFTKTENGKLLLDIKKALLFDLHQLGVKPKNIFDAGICSFENDAYDEQSCDLSDFVLPAALAIAKGECDRGIFVDGVGYGSAMIANKVSGIYACVCQDPFCAQLARQHNDANVLCLGAKIIGGMIAMEIVKTFMSTDPLTADKYVRRVKKVQKINDEYCVPVK